MFFVYETTNEINGKKYIGKKKGDPEVETGYRGSGTALKAAIAKYGIENFSRRTIEICETHQEVCDREEYWIEHFGAADSPLFYNLSKLYRGNARPLSEEHKAKISKALKGKTKSRLGTKWSPEQRAKHRETIATREKVYTPRGPLAPETIEKMKATRAKGDYSHVNQNKRGVPWSEERRARFVSTKDGKPKRVMPPVTEETKAKLKEAQRIRREREAAMK